jgi:hypothetical protein
MKPREAAPRDPRVAVELVVLQNFLVFSYAHHSIKQGKQSNNPPVHYVPFKSSPIRRS